MENQNIDCSESSEKNKIEQYIRTNMKKGKLPGLSVTIVKDGKTMYQTSFGYANMETKERINADTLFELGSNSKAFTALAIYELQKEGYLSVEDTVEQYIPWFYVSYHGNKESITIQQLLHQTSGIPFATIDKIPESDKESALEDTVRKLQGLKLDTKPGEEFQYATINYDILGLIIEKVTGETYEDYMEKHILQSLGLSNTYLNENTTENPVANGYKLFFTKQKVYQAPQYRGNKPAGYIMSNSIDMTKWLNILMGDSLDSKLDPLVTKQSLDANREVVPLKDGSSYASGWFVYQKGGGEISHGGNNPNFSSYIVFRPKEKIGVAVLCNTNSYYVEEIGQGIIEMLQGKKYNPEVKDLNINADRIAFVLILVELIILLITFIFICKEIKEIRKGKRKLVKITVKKVIQLIFSLLFMVALSLCIYLMPYILYQGVSWNFVFVWLPGSISYALVTTYVCIWVIYFYFIFASLFKKDDDMSLLLLSIVSIASGFGNALIIFTINMAINSSNGMKIKLLVYFSLGIILYVYGQKIVRKKLIDITNHIVFSKRIQIVNCILKASYKNFEEIQKGRIESTLNNDTEKLSDFANDVTSGITSAITLLCCFAYLGSINRYALILSVVIILFIASIYFFVGVYARRIGEEARDLQNNFFKYMNDLLGGFKELSLNHRKRKEFRDDMEQSCDSYRIKRGQSEVAFANIFIIGELLFTIAIGSIAIIFPIVLDHMELKNVTSYVFILLYMVGPVHGILNTIPSLINVKISVKRMNGLLEELSGTEHSYNQGVEVETEQSICLQLNQVEYVYEKNDTNSFCVGPISYEFQSGEITFVTGGNGSGKSTLAKLVSGLYQPSKGDILLNGKCVSSNTLGENFTTVFGDFYVFDKLYGIDYLEKDEEISKYLKLLQLDKKVDIQDGKFSTIKLSTGQKKRLALLVTYLENRPIYLFDEWAADQDPEFRNFFYNSLLPDLKERGKCVIAITHDNQYFHLADKIIKMDMGKLYDIE